MTERDFREMEQILKEQRELVSRDPVAALELLTHFNLLHLCVPKDTYQEMEHAAEADPVHYMQSDLSVFLCN